MPTKLTPKQQIAAAEKKFPASKHKRQGRNPHNITVIDGLTFGSGAEARRYQDLKLMQMAGEISDLEPHPAYELIVNGIKIGGYTGDSRYVKDGQLIVEDVKGDKSCESRDYPLRKKLMKALHGIDIQEYPPRIRKTRKKVRKK